MIKIRNGQNKNGFIWSLLILKKPSIGLDKYKDNVPEMANTTKITTRSQLEPIPHRCLKLCKKLI